MIEQTETNTEEEVKKNDSQPINWDDINNLDDDGEQYEVDQDADALSREAPPVPGVINFLFTVDPETGVAKKSITSRRTKEKIEYFSVGFALVAKSDDEKVDGATCYINASTLYNPKKKTSTLMTILSKLGVKVSDVKSDIQQIKKLKEFIDQEPIRPLQTDWELSYKNSDGKYITRFRSFKDFPIDRSTTSGRKEVFEITLDDKSKVEVRPRLKIISYNPTGSSSTSYIGASVANKPIKSTTKIDKETADLEKEL